MFHIMFVLDCITDVWEVLLPNEPLKTIAFSETLDSSAAMFPNPTCKIARYADIERPIGSVCDDINPSTMHEVSFDRVDGRNKSGHDGCGP